LLWRRDIPVYLGDTVPLPFGVRSRYFDGSLVHPNPYFHEEFVETLVRWLEEGETCVLFPASTDTVSVISAYLGRIQAVTECLVPCFDTLMMAVDRLEILRIARGAGIPVPETRPLTDPGDVEVFPAIAKPRYETGGAAGLRLLRDGEDAVKALELEENFGPMILQEYVPGPSTQMRGCNLLYNARGEPRAVFTMSKIREHKSTGGITLSAVSTRDAVVADQAKRLLGSIDWRGLAEVEFKVDPRDGEAKLMEINPRFWAYLEFPVRCGVDFPYLYYRLCTGEEFDPVDEYRTGVGYANLRRKPSRIPLSYLSAPRKNGLVIDLPDPRGVGWFWMLMLRIRRHLRGVDTRRGKALRHVMEGKGVG